MSTHTVDESCATRACDDLGSLRRPDRRRLIAALAVTVVFLAVEVIGGLLSGSLAVLSDAGHMLADVFALTLSLFALKLATLPATPAKSWGYYRLEILSALVNGVVLCLVAVAICREGWLRLTLEHEVATTPMIMVAMLGLVANLAAAWILHGGAHDLNLRGAYLHVLGDTLSSVGVVVGGLLIAVTGETRIDAAIGIVIGVVILWSAQRLVRDAVDVLLEAIPKGLEPPQVTRVILAIDGVVGLHDLHVWSLTTGVEALTAHVQVRHRDLDRCADILAEIDREMRERFRIAHTTIQVEPVEAPSRSSVPVL